MKAINRVLDRLVRPEIHVLHKSWPAFQVCGYTGLALAILLAMGLVVSLGLSPLVMTAIILSALATFLGLAMAIKIVTGEENLVYYHHAIAAMIVAALVLWLLRQPILPCLDVTILGIGLFVAYGRIGCLMVGCCHGRPHRWGVCYRAEHGDAGFTPYYVGIRLFPIQAIESLWLFFTICAGSLLLLSASPAGSALTWYVVAYGLGRFCFEFMRGDPDRPYRWGFSEAKWTSLTLIGVAVVAELADILPVHIWHVTALAGLVLVMLAVTLVRRVRGTARHRLLHPRHVKEVADALEQVSAPVATQRDSVSANIPVACTSLGIQISHGQIWRGMTCFDHYALSSRTGVLSEDGARVLAGLILQLAHAPASSEFVPGNRGMFHLLIRSTGRRAAQEGIAAPDRLTRASSLQQTGRRGASGQSLVKS